jgi:hypothetical protein
VVIKLISMPEILPQPERTDEEIGTTCEDLVSSARN